MSATVETLRWVGGRDGHLLLIDQTRLPCELVEFECRDMESVFEAIRGLRVRGAPAIGIAAAYGVCLGLRTCSGIAARRDSELHANDRNHERNSDEFRCAGRPAEAGDAEFFRRL